MVDKERKADNLIWYLMATAISVLVLTGGSWAMNVNAKMDKVLTLEANVQAIQNDIAAIKNLIISALKKGGHYEFRIED